MEHLVRLLLFLCVRVETLCDGTKNTRESCIEQSVSLLSCPCVHAETLCDGAKDTCDSKVEQAVSLPIRWCVRVTMFEMVQRIRVKARWSTL